jgi:predicted TPR repeat methyltransferase
MLARARGQQVYDDLIQAELTDFMDRKAEAYDVIASADTLCYFGDVAPVFQAAAKALRPSGVLAFTLEDAGEEGPGFRLHPYGRYAHRRSYVENTLDAASLAVLSIASVVLRKEGGHPVAGHLVVARKQLVA